MNQSKPICPLCTREMFFPSKHHLLPQSQGGKETRQICRDCHDAIHALYDANQIVILGLTTIEALQNEEQLSRVFKFISKQPPTKRTTTRTSKYKKKRGF